MGNENTFDSYSEKRVSYILVTKDRANLLEKSLLNVKSFKTARDELIVVNGGSSDETIEVIKKYHELIDKIISEQDLSPAHGVNKGILISCGKYIKYLTDDDILYKGALYKAISILEKHPEIDLLVCGGIRKRFESKRINVSYAPPRSNYGQSIKDVFKYGTNAMGYIIRRKSLAKIGLAPTDLIADFTFIKNCFLSNAVIRFCRVKLYFQNVHESTITSLNQKEVNRLLFKFVKENTSYSYFFRYSINWFFWEHPNFRMLFFLPLKLWGFLKKNISEPEKQSVIEWDGGLS